MRNPNARVPFQVIEWAAAECERQRSGEPSVGWMVAGWLYARTRRNRMPRYADVLALGKIVEPRKASNGVRTVGVRVGNDVKMHSELVPEALSRLLLTLKDSIAPSDCDEWYRQYEEIHPFADGNGRTGSILWNWLRGSLEEPEDPPDFWTRHQENTGAFVLRRMLEKEPNW